MTEEIRQDIQALRDFDVDDLISMPSVLKTILNRAADLVESLSVQLDQVTRERDAAVEDLRKVCRVVSVCFYCKSRDAEYVSNDCMDCVNSCNWKWRGVEVEKSENT